MVLGGWSGRDLPAAATTALLIAFDCSSGGRAMVVACCDGDRRPLAAWLDWLTGWTLGCRWLILCACEHLHVLLSFRGEEGQWFGSLG